MRNPDQKIAPIYLFALAACGAPTLDPGAEGASEPARLGLDAIADSETAAQLLSEFETLGCTPVLDSSSPGGDEIMTGTYAVTLSRACVESSPAAISTIVATIEPGQGVVGMTGFWLEVDVSTEEAYPSAFFGFRVDENGMRTNFDNQSEYLEAEVGRLAGGFAFLESEAAEEAGTFSQPAKPRVGAMVADDSALGDEDFGEAGDREPYDRNGCLECQGKHRTTQDVAATLCDEAKALEPRKDMCEYYSVPSVGSFFSRLFTRIDCRFFAPKDVAEATQLCILTNWEIGKQARVAQDECFRTRECDYGPACTPEDFGGTTAPTSQYCIDNAREELIEGQYQKIFPYCLLGDHGSFQCCHVPGDGMHGTDCFPL
jgi:hypothetical protein